MENKYVMNKFYHFLVINLETFINSFGFSKSMNAALKAFLLGSVIVATQACSEPSKTETLEQKVALVQKQEPQRNTQKYDSWINTTINNSKQNDSYAIIIDKDLRELYVMKSGELVNKFSVELGFNPVDDKQREGDGTTPEGMYSATKLNRTSFYKAMLINYPNANDFREFEEGKKNGTIPEMATIGGAVEIHGCGSGYKGNSEAGNDWTAGCVALSNKNMDSLFETLPKTVPVTIVKYKGVEIKWTEESL